MIKELIMPKWIKIIYLLNKEDLNGSDIVRKLDSFENITTNCFGNICNILNLLVRHQLINKTKVGRNKVYSLTPKGKYISNKIVKIIKELNNEEE